MDVYSYIIDPRTTLRNIKIGSDSQSTNTVARQYYGSIFTISITGMIAFSFHSSDGRPT